jgi:hypothetical protein
MPAAPTVQSPPETEFRICRSSPPSTGVLQRPRVPISCSRATCHPATPRVETLHVSSPVPLRHPLMALSKLPLVSRVDQG